MVIREMSREECLGVLARGRLARLACARANQPYVVPVYFAYHEASACLWPPCPCPGAVRAGMPCIPPYEEYNQARKESDDPVKDNPARAGRFITE